MYLFIATLKVRVGPVPEPEPWTSGLVQVWTRFEWFTNQTMASILQPLKISKSCCSTPSLNFSYSCCNTTSSSLSCSHCNTQCPLSSLSYSHCNTNTPPSAYPSHVATLPPQAYPLLVSTLPSSLFHSHCNTPLFSLLFAWCNTQMRPLRVQTRSLLLQHFYTILYLHKSTCTLRKYDDFVLKY